MAQSALQSGHGNKASLLGGVLRRLDEALENASERYLAANRRFAQAPRDIEAVQAGRDAAMRRRTEDTIPAFRRLSARAREYPLRVLGAVTQPRRAGRINLNFIGAPRPTKMGTTLSS